MKKFFSLFFSPLTKEEIASTDDIPHFYFVDLIRGLSALVILVWHYQHFYWTQANQLNFDKTRQPFFNLLMPFYTDGYWAVQLFWMISGFVFAYVYAQKRTNAVNYFTNRFSRLYPLHFFTLIIVAILQYFSIKYFGYYQIVTFNNVYHFFLNVFFMAHWGFQDGSSFNTPIWSVSVEEGIFIFFFFLHRIIFAGGIFLCLAIIGLGYAITIRGTPLWFFGMCALYFFSGVLVYFYLIRFRKYIKLHIIICVISLIIFAVFLKRYFSGRIPFTTVEFFLFLPLLLLTALADFKYSNKESLSKILKIFKSIGDLTYSSYLLHFPIQLLVLIIFQSFNIDQNLFDSKIAFVIWVGSVILASILSFKFIEMPAKRYLRKNLPDRLTSSFDIINNKSKN